MTHLEMRIVEAATFTAGAPMEDLPPGPEGFPPIFILGLV
jgi:hypothetical protein